MFKTEKNKFLKNVMTSLDELHVVYEKLNTDGIQKLIPIADTQGVGPPKLPSDPRFGQPTGESIAGVIYVSESGLNPIKNS